MRRHPARAHTWGYALTACFAAAALGPRLCRADEPRGLPSFMANKPRMDDADRKEEGSFLSGVPALGYDTNTGFGAGAGGFYTIDGKKTDPLFDYTPYRHRVFAQLYITTGGYQQYEVAYDGLYLGNSPYRLRTYLMFERNTNANYFGNGTSTLDDLSFRGVSHARYNDQTSAASTLQADGTASPYYNHYTYDKPQAKLALERDFWGGRVRAQYGAIVQYLNVERYDGRPVQAKDAAGNDVTVTHGPSKLGEDCAAGLALGCSGGWNNMLKAGVALDTRDFEPDPDNGVFADLTGEWSSKGFGSAYNYLRATLATRFYWAPFPKVRVKSPLFGRVSSRVVFAGRLLYSVQTGDVPFYAMDALALTEDDQSGLGGEYTLRGFRQGRFIGRVAALGQAEVRWTFFEFEMLKQRFTVQFAPLLDVGRVFDRVELSTDRWKVSAGAGWRIAWNKSTVIIFDLGVSREDIGFYIDLGTGF